MKQLKIENWQQHGEYMIYANMVDETKQWIMLTTSGNVITALGKQEGIDALKKLLDKKKITYKEI